MKIAFCSLIVIFEILFASSAHSEVNSMSWDDLGEVQGDTFEKKYGYTSLQAHSERIFSICYDTKCHIMKVLKSTDVNENLFKESIHIQNKAAALNIAVPVLHMGTFSDSESADTTSTYYFMISVEADRDIENCKQSSRNIEFFVNTLSRHGLIHGDLDVHSGNLVCLEGEKVLIDFDLGYDLDSFSHDIQQRILFLEKYCTVQKTIEPMDESIAFLFQDKKESLQNIGQVIRQDRNANLARMLPECMCRKKHFHVPNVNCTHIREKIFSEDKGGQCHLYPFRVD